MHYRCLNTCKTSVNLFEWMRSVPRALDELCEQSLWNCSRLQDLSCVDKLREDYACQCPSTICQYNDENRLIGFVDQSCSAETFQGIHWSKTLVNKGQHVPCPYPCTGMINDRITLSYIIRGLKLIIGQIFRFCQVDRQWSKANYTSCQCSTDKITRVRSQSFRRHRKRVSPQVATHYFASSYVFQCHSWLINRLLPTDNPCILVGVDLFILLACQFMPLFDLVVF